MCEISFQCSGCRRSFEVPTSMAGTQAKCMTCGTVLTVSSPRQQAKISFNCRQCGKAFQAPADLAGKQARCGHCQAIVTVPGQGSTTVAAPTMTTNDPLWDDVLPTESAAPGTTILQGPSNPYSAPRTRRCRSAVRPRSGNRAELWRVAFFQKGVLTCLLLYPLTGFFWIFPLVSPWVNTLSGLCFLLAAVAGPVFVFLLSIQVFGVGEGIAMGILFGILSFIPCLGLIMLVIINQKATSMLQEKGIKVGLLGASLSKI